MEDTAFERLSKNVLITGPPRVGKTTAIVAVAKALEDKADGFYTTELRELGRRTGFLVVSLRGEEGLLAHINLKQGPRVGKYTVNLEDLESVGVAALRRACRHSPIVIIDEIGKMELFSEAFRREVLKALDSPPRVLATIRQGREPFCDSIKRRRDVTVIELTERNREALPGQLVTALLER